MATLRSLNIKITANTSPLEKSLANMQLKLANFSEQTTKLGRTISTSITAPLVAMGGAAIGAFAKMEKMQTALTSAFRGNEAAAKKAFSQIKEFSANTPFQLEEITNAFVKLKNYGLDPSMEALNSYGNTASALGKSLNDMVEAVADAVTGEFERLKEFGIKARKQGSDVAFTFQGITTTVKNNSEEIEKYLRGIGDVNFAGAIEKQSRTLIGQFSTLKDNISLALVSIGEELASAFDLSSVVDQVTKKIKSIVTAFQEMDNETKTAIIGWGLFAAALGPGIFALGKIVALGGGVVKSVRLMVTAVKTGGGVFAVLTSSVAATVAAIASLGLVAAYVYKNWQAFTGRFANIWEEIVWSASNGIRKLKKILNDWQESLGINIWKFKDTEQLKAPDLIDVPSFQSAGEFIKSLGRDLAGLVGIQSKAASSVADSIGLPSTDTGGAGGGGASGGGGGGSKGWGGAAQENIAKIAAGYQGVALSIKSATVAHAEMTMKMVEGTTTALTAMQSMTLGLADSFSQLAESGSASMSDLSKAVVSEIRKMIVAKIRLGVASAIGEKMAAGPFGIFLAAGAGLAASAIFSRILGSLKIPALAQGGAAFGPTLAMVGDNPNAMRDPELIMPFSKMKKMILDDIMPGAGRVQEVRIASSAIEIDGRKLRILLEQENNYARGLR